MKIKKISFKNMSDTLTDNEMKNVLGGYFNNTWRCCCGDRSSSSNCYNYSASSYSKEGAAAQAKSDHGTCQYINGWECA